MPALPRQILSVVFEWRYQIMGLGAPLTSITTGKWAQSSAYRPLELLGVLSDGLYQRTNQDRIHRERAQFTT
ncbi:11935_t:CDS:2 [Acaulospora colombiana]|uniref:11935_t:CDS:1 n=1 Tax=Acaulospora colombiana TaxID=27376 RepID=A0ACA9MXY0_9GLOM|nr:11935_t:CDS:2 [Acaulospora colombiana]